MELVVKFNSPVDGGRKNIPDLQCGLYRPHLVVEERPNDEYLGVQFVGCRGPIEFGKEIPVTVNLPYKEIDYSMLQPGVSFLVKEGGKTVGSGRVEKL
ncbi:hypothetical protein [Microbulbifer hainanensis]|uniref:hypothetical protein n=1 Tax=Microbulbifer hainanensis TaxID=2735675 RepID=UPI001865EED0|nr:hypothetical protein [Microbulbifer hainanensis]